jgi:branched-chain amino acid:cation transporter, LIVCS family
MTFTGFIALIDGLTLSDVSPLSAYGMEWIIPALVGTAFDILLSQIGQSAPAEEHYNNEVSR